MFACPLSPNPGNRNASIAYFPVSRPGTLSYRICVPVILNQFPAAFLAYVKRARPAAPQESSCSIRRHSEPPYITDHHLGWAKYYSRKASKRPLLSRLVSSTYTGQYLFSPKENLRSSKPLSSSELSPAPPARHITSDA